MLKLKVYLILLLKIQLTTCYLLGDDGIRRLGTTPKITDELLSASEDKEEFQSGTSALQVAAISHHLPLAETSVNDESLLKLLMFMVEKELRGCSLVIAHGKEVQEALVGSIISEMLVSRQIVKITETSDFYKISWKSSPCRGYLFLQWLPESLETFADYHDYIWDYSGRYIIVGLNKTELRKLSVTQKVHNTENFIGIVKSDRSDEWLVFTNQIVSQVGIRLVGSWKLNRFATQKLDLFPDKLSNLKGTPLTVGTFEYRPSVMFERDEKGGIIDRYGRDVLVAEALVEAFNAKLIYRNIPQNEVWGQLLPNGSWTGLMGTLQRGEVDIGIANIYITNVTKRLLVSDCSAPFDIEVSGFLSRKPKPLPEWERIIYPFEPETWIAIFAGLVVSGPLLMYLAKAGNSSGGESHDMQGLSFAYLYAAGIHFMEGQAITPRRRGLQIFISFLWIYAIIVTTGYNSNLTALLTVSRQPATIDTIKGIYESDMKLAASGHVFKMSLLRSSNPYLNALADRYEEYNGKPDVMKSLVEEGKTLILAGQNVLRYMAAMEFTQGEESTARIIKETFSPFNVAVALQRGSPLKRKVDIFIQRMAEAGLIRYWFKASLRRAKKESEKNQENEGSASGKGNTETVETSTDDGVQALGFSHMQGFFFILFVGYIASALAFTLELTVVRLA